MQPGRAAQDSNSMKWQTKYALFWVSSNEFMPAAIDWLWKSPSRIRAHLSGWQAATGGIRRDFRTSGFSVKMAGA